VSPPGQLPERLGLEEEGAGGHRAELLSRRRAEEREGECGFCLSVVGSMEVGGARVI
jgi:hypothetical protein